MKKLTGMAMIKALVKDLTVLEARTKKLHTERPDFKNKEAMGEIEFVRKFGTKVRKVKYSRRADFVGLMVLGNNVGFWVVRDNKGRRKARLLDVMPDGRVAVTNRYLGLRENDSMSNLWRGLLNYVQ